MPEFTPTLREWRDNIKLSVSSQGCLSLLRSTGWTWGAEVEGRRLYVWVFGWRGGWGARQAVGILPCTALISLTTGSHMHFVRPAGGNNQQRHPGGNVWQRECHRLHGDSACQAAGWASTGDRVLFGYVAFILLPCPLLLEAWHRLSAL